jgi:hypothetical protein
MAERFSVFWSEKFKVQSSRFKVERMDFALRLIPGCAHKGNIRGMVGGAHPTFFPW